MGRYPSIIFGRGTRRSGLGTPTIFKDTSLDLASAWRLVSKRRGRVEPFFRAGIFVAAVTHVDSTLSICFQLLKGLSAANFPERGSRSYSVGKGDFAV